MEFQTDGQTAINLLYVEDDVQSQEIIIQILQSEFPGINVIKANNGQEGLDLYSKNCFEIVVTDVHIPIFDGIQMSKKIKEINKDANIIVLSAADDVNYLIEAIDIGINCYVLKPIKVDKLFAAVKRCLDRINLSKQLIQKEEFIRRMAYFDFLTGLPNRYLFGELLHKSLANAQRNKHHLAVLFLDVNGFKDINDTHGHSIGDQLLIDIAKRLQLCCEREQDTVARWGGDEFIILLPDNDGPQETEGVVQKINAAFKAPIILQNITLDISISIGISYFPENGTDGETLIKNADFAMYCAKNWDRKKDKF